MTLIDRHRKIGVVCTFAKSLFQASGYQMSDDKGNRYAMHATETGTPNLNVVLPEGFTVQKVALKEPLVIMPFGEKEDCYFNIVGDHLGAGYHQYQYANDFYPSKSNDKKNKFKSKRHSTTQCGMTVVFCNIEKDICKNTFLPYINFFINSLL